MEQGDIKFTDAEFDTSGQEKIDYAQILMNQINYVRFLMSQDMGQFIFFDLQAYNSDIQKETFWFGNLAKFINSVESFKSLLITYHNKEFKANIKKLNEDFNKAYKQELLKVKNDKDKYKKEKGISMLFNLKHKITLYSKIFEECLLLAQDAGYIGGNDQVSDMV